MNNQQTTPKEYQSQADIAKLLASYCANQLVSELDEMTINNIVDDDIVFPYSGDHLGKFRYEYEYVSESILQILESHVPQFNVIKLCVDKCSCGHEYKMQFIPQQHAAHVGIFIEEYVNDVI